MSARFDRSTVISAIVDESFIPRTIDAPLACRVVLTPALRNSGSLRRPP
jgi:hypothetical protein